MANVNLEILDELEKLLDRDDIFVDTSTEQKEFCEFCGENPQKVQVVTYTVNSAKNVDKPFVEVVYYEQDGYLKKYNLIRFKNISEKTLVLQPTSDTGWTEQFYVAFKSLVSKLNKKLYCQRNKNITGKTQVKVLNFLRDLNNQKVL